MANHNFIFTDISHALPFLMKAVLDGDEVGSRNGRVLELLHPHIVLTESWRREITTPGRKASLPAQIAETMWVLSGRDDIAFLGNYLPRAKDFSDDGVRWQGAYGPRLRAWKRRDKGDVLDQLAWVVDLLKKDPLSRRAVMVIYDPDVDSADGGLDRPCNDIIQFQSRLGELHMHVFIRSNDLMWGFSGINAFEWSSLQEIVAGLLGIGVGELHFSVSSEHLYEPHWAKAQRISDGAYLAEQSTVASPRFNAAAVWRSLEEFDRLVLKWFALENVIRNPGSATSRRDLLDAVNNFPEPMLRSWLQVIAWHWSRDESFLEPLRGTPLALAAKLSPTRKDPVVQPPEAPRVIAPAGFTIDRESSFRFTMPAVPVKESFEVEDPFIDFVVNLHAEKHAVYGDSWKRRGELLGILANIARKIDRLGVAGAGDTASDTVIDLLVYLVKYRLWMTDNLGATQPAGIWDAWQTEHGPLSDRVEPVTDMLRSIPVNTSSFPSVAMRTLERQFAELEKLAQNGSNPGQRREVVDAMIPLAASVARRIWQEEQPESEGARIEAWQAGNATRSWQGYDSDDL
jgi:thymidylate synthase